MSAQFERHGDPSAVDDSVQLSLTERDYRTYNVLKRFPALVDYITIIFCAIGPWLFFYVALWALLIFLLGFQVISLLQGYFLVVGVNRLAKRQRKDPPQSLASHYFVLIIPNYKEDPSTLRMTLDHLADMAWAKDRFLVVLGMEGGEKDCESKAAMLEEEYQGRFKEITHSVHPRGLAGETAGKHSNENWAGRHAYEVFVGEVGYNLDDLLVTTLDSDTLHAENYFVKVEAAMKEKPERRYNTIFCCPFYNYQNQMDPQVPRFNAYFDMMWACVTFGLLAKSDYTLKLPASSYTLPMRFVRDLDFWDKGPEALAEDEHMALKAFFATNGNIEIHTIYEVMNVGTVFGETIGAGIKAKLIQLRRHFQSNVDVGYAFTMLMRRFTRLSFGSIWALSMRLFELFFLLTMSPICGFVGWLQITIRVMSVPSLRPEGLPDWYITLVTVVTIVMNLTWVFILCLLTSAERLKTLGPDTHNSVKGNRRWWHMFQYLWMVMATVAIVFVSMWARTAILLDRGKGFNYVVAAKTHGDEANGGQANGHVEEPGALKEGEDAKDGAGLMDVSDGDDADSQKGLLSGENGHEADKGGVV